MRYINALYLLTYLYTDTIIMPPPFRGGTLSDDERLISVCLSVTYIEPKLRTERPRKNIIGTELTLITRDSDFTFKVKRSSANLQWRGILLMPTVVFVTDIIVRALDQCTQIRLLVVKEPQHSHSSTDRTHYIDYVTLRGS